MPVAADPWQVPHFPKFLIALIPIGCLLMGWGLNDFSFLRASHVGEGAVTLTQHGTRLVTATRTVERRVHGKVVTKNERIYVQVPVVVVHTDHHTIRVPQHLLPIRSAEATVANPLVTVQVAVPTTIYVPTTFYSTVTSTVTSTETQTVPTTITVTLPLDTTSPPPA